MRVAVMSGATRGVRTPAHTIPTMAKGRSSQISMGRSSSQERSGVQAMSEDNPILATRGRAQMAEMAKPQTHADTVRLAPPFHHRIGIEASTTTMVVRTWERAVAARATAAQVRYLR